MNYLMAQYVTNNKVVCLKLDQSQGCCASNPQNQFDTHKSYAEGCVGKAKRAERSGLP